MAKIIGYEKVKKQYKATCKKCGAIIIFDEDEVCHGSQYTEFFYHACCPNCGKNVYFNKENEYITND